MMSSMGKVYLDHSATTPLDKRVLDAMMPYFTEHFGNASSAHSFGRKAEEAIENARETVAAIFNCKAQEIIFTSGGSESDNLAIRGAAWAARSAGRGQHLITTPVEHTAVSRTVEQLTTLMGFDATILDVDQYGIVDVEDFIKQCHPRATVASIIYVNNEVGSIMPLPQLAKAAIEQGVLLHTDAVQAAGQLSLDVEALGIDMMSISAHKFYGPKGVGALFVREGVPLTPSQTGGSHEGGYRAGTLNTPYIVGMAKALQIAHDERDQHLAHFTLLRMQLVDGVLSRVSDSRLTGHPDNRLPSHASFVFADVDSNMLLMHLDMKGIAASSSSACKTGNAKPSGVLLAMGYKADEALGSLRLSVGRSTTSEHIDYVVETLVSVVEKLRKLKKTTL